MGVLPRGVLGTPPVGLLCQLSVPLLVRLTSVQVTLWDRAPETGRPTGHVLRLHPAWGSGPRWGVGAAAAVGVPGSPSQPLSMHSEAIIRTAAGNFNPPFLWQLKCLEGSDNARKIHFKNVRATNRLLNTPRTPGLGRAWLCRLLGRPLRPWSRTAAPGVCCTGAAPSKAKEPVRCPQIRAAGGGVQPPGWGRALTWS